MSGESVLCVFGQIISAEALSGAEWGQRRNVLSENAAFWGRNALKLEPRQTGRQQRGPFPNGCSIRCSNASTHRGTDVPLKVLNQFRFFKKKNRLDMGSDVSVTTNSCFSLLITSYDWEKRNSSTCSDGRVTMQPCFVDAVSMEGLLSMNCASLHWRQMK